MDLEKLVADARAQLIWGEPRERILQNLRNNGIGEKQAAALVTNLEEEKFRPVHSAVQSAVQSAGINHLVMGLGLIGAGLVTISIWPVSSSWDLNHFLGVVFAFAMIDFLFIGAWKIHRGVKLLGAPQAARRDWQELGD